MKHLCFISTEAEGSSVLKNWPSLYSKLFRTVNLCLPLCHTMNHKLVKPQSLIYTVQTRPFKFVVHYVCKLGELSKGRENVRCVNVATGLLWFQCLILVHQLFYVISAGISIAPYSFLNQELCLNHRT